MKAGRPLKYETVEKLEEAISDYFASNPEKPTITGLALELGFTSRQSLYDYKERQEFSYTIKKAFTQELQVVLYFGSKTENGAISKSKFIADHYQQLGWK